LAGLGAIHDNVTVVYLAFNAISDLGAAGTGKEKNKIYYIYTYLLYYVTI